MAWYREWFGEEYLGLYAHRDTGEAKRHVDFVARAFESGPRPNAVLDLACGAGRHTAALRARGYRTLGVDLSMVLLAASSQTGSSGWPRVAGDMRALPFRPAAFDWVLNFFTSFGYFETEHENFRVLAEIRRVLAAAGRFLIDFLNLDHALAHLEPEESTRLRDERVGVELQAEIDRWWDPRTRRLNKRIRLYRAGSSGPARTFLESVRGYRPDEIEAGLDAAGLEVCERFGGFDGEPFAPATSGRLILVGKVKAA
jgi:SAM-dependent methyltransferase